MDTEMPCFGSILWAEPINELLTAFRTNGPAEKLYGPEEVAFELDSDFHVECNTVDDSKCNTALWVAEYASWIQGVGSLGPVFNVDLSR